MEPSEGLRGAPEGVLDIENSNFFVPKILAIQRKYILLRDPHSRLGVSAPTK